MTHRKGAVWTERLLLVMILGSLAGTLNLVLTLHRPAAKVSSASLAQPSTPTSPPRIPGNAHIAEKVVTRPSSPKPRDLVPAPTPVPIPRAVVAAEDPTVKILAGMTSALGKELGAAREADRRAGKWETARRAALGESQRWKRREVLVRQQIAALTRRAEGLEQNASALDVERDVLARERDLLKAALTEASRRSSYAVLPYKGPNGTWRRPIVLECTGTVAKLRPKGPTFSMLDLSPLIHPRSSPVVLAIAREMLLVERSETPAGSPAVPYLVFLVRPNGIRPYYEARARLEPLGIAFGYELIEQDLAVEVPDLDDLTTWDGTVPLESPGLAAAVGRPGPAQGGRAGPGPGWSDRATGVGGGLTVNGGIPPGGASAAGSDEGSPSPDDFVWPSQARRDGLGRGPGSAPARWGAGENTGLSSEPGTSTAGTQPTPSPSLGFTGGDGSPGLGPDGGARASRSRGNGSGLGGPAAALNPAAGRGASGPVGLGPGASGLPAAGRGGLLVGSEGDGGSSDAMTTAGGGSGSPGPVVGSGRSGTGGIAPGTLPDLEPVHNDGARPPMPVGGGSMAGAAGPQGGMGRVRLLGADQAGSGLSAPGGPTAMAADALDRGPMSTSPAVASNQPGGDRSALIGTRSPSGSTTDSSSVDASPSSPSSPATLAGSASASSATTRGAWSPASSSPGSRSSPLAGLTSSLASSAADNGNDSAWSSPSGNSGASGSSTATSGMSLPSLGLKPDTDSESSFLKDFNLPPLTPPDRPTGAIEVPFPIVVVCRRNDVLLHPGGYRLTTEALRAGAGKGSSQESLLKRELLALVRRRAQVDPMIRPRPSVKFLIETGGSTTFWTARRQLLFSGLDWPMSLQVAGPQNEPVLTGTTK